MVPGMGWTGIHSFPIETFLKTIQNVKLQLENSMINRLINYFQSAGIILQEKSEGVIDMGSDSAHSITYLFIR